MARRPASRVRDSGGTSSRGQQPAVRGRWGPRWQRAQRGFAEHAVAGGGYVAARAACRLWWPVVWMGRHAACVGAWCAAHWWVGEGKHVAAVLCSTPTGLVLTATGMQHGSRYTGKSRTVGSRTQRRGLRNGRLAAAVGWADVRRCNTAQVGRCRVRAPGKKFNRWRRVLYLYLMSSTSSEPMSQMGYVRSRYRVCNHTCICEAPPRRCWLTLW